MQHADARRRLGVRANADNGEDSARAVRFGAQGIGLTRTEHMFLGERRQLVEQLILAEDEAGRTAALDALEPLQRGDFVEILEAMDGLPVTIRLLDPPLHEFLPDLTELSVKIALAGDNGHREGPQAAGGGAPAARAEPDARPARRPARPGHPRPVRDAGAGDRAGGGRPGQGRRRPAAGDHDPAGRRGAGAGDRPRGGRAGARRGRGGDRRAGAHPDRHDDRGAAGRADRRADRRGRRVLLVRHQRPDPDGLGLLPRRRRGLVLQPLHRPGHLRRLAVRDAGHRGHRPAGQDRRRGGPGRPART